MKILVAVDGSAFTKRMLAYLAAHDQWLGSAHQYTVVYCSPYLPPRAAAFLDHAAIESYYDDEAEKVFVPIRAFFQQRGIEVDFTALVGQPGFHIAELATEGKFDLLAMGSHGHGVLANLVLGSVVTKVLANCNTPMLIVR